MRILQVHNRYRLRGGEEAVVENTEAVLRRHGDEASRFEKASDDLGVGIAAKLGAVFSAIYSPRSRREMAARIVADRPDVVHIHNLYPLLSPSILLACRDARVPVVMTVHNYRLMCPIAVHFRDGHICEDCLGGREWMCLLNNCRDSRMESAAYALRNWTVRTLGFYKKHVNQFLAISAFLKERLVEAGYPEGRVRVVPNMIGLPETAVDPAQGEYAGFAGRASAEKGIDVLVAAAQLAPDVPVTIAGHGPMLAQYQQDAPSNVTFPGMLSREQLTDFYRRARFLVVPSQWHETFGLVAVEAMSHGVPVVASKIGGLQEIVRDGETGLTFEPGNAQDLAEKMRALWADPARCRALGEAARKRVAAHYSEEVYVKNLLAAYESAIEGARLAGKAPR
jgi:glycosyltransferase involved in cell wall biosynthesis